MIDVLASNRMHWCDKCQATTTHSNGWCTRCPILTAECSVPYCVKLRTPPADDHDELLLLLDSWLHDMGETDEVRHGISKYALNCLSGAIGRDFWYNSSSKILYVREVFSEKPHSFFHVCKMFNIKNAHARHDNVWCSCGCSLFRLQYVGCGISAACHLCGTEETVYSG